LSSGPPTALGLDIVSKIGIPILGSVCIGFIVLLVQSVEGEKEASAARQAKLALDIANKTLPLSATLTRSRCVRSEIIRHDIHAMPSLSPILTTCWPTSALASTTTATMMTP
jgi:two-component system LytT family sensor kinase